jgi:hypothetical protein
MATKKSVGPISWLRARAYLVRVDGVSVWVFGEENEGKTAFATDQSDWTDVSKPAMRHVYPHDSGLSPQQIGYDMAARWHRYVKKVARLRPEDMEALEKVRGKG